MFHDMFVYLSGLGRVHGTKNETLARLQDPEEERGKGEAGRNFVLRSSRYVDTYRYRAPKMKH